MSGAKRIRAVGRSGARARRIEYGYHALPGANVATSRTIWFEEESRDFPTRVYSVGPHPLPSGRAGARRVEAGETALLGSKKTVAHVVRVTGESDDRPGRAMLKA